jgi:hypothetical protein
MPGTPGMTVTSDSVRPMGTVRRLAAAAGDVTLGQAAEAYLVTLGGAEQASTRRTYGRILRRVVAEFGPETRPTRSTPSGSLSGSALSGPTGLTEGEYLDRIIRLWTDSPG